MEVRQKLSPDPKQRDSKLEESQRSGSRYKPAVVNGDIKGSVVQNQINISDPHVKSSPSPTKLNRSPSPGKQQQQRQSPLVNTWLDKQAEQQKQSEEPENPIASADGPKQTSSQSGVTNITNIIYNINLMQNKGEQANAAPSETP